MNWNISNTRFTIVDTICLQVSFIQIKNYNFDCLIIIDDWVVDRYHL